MGVKHVIKKGLFSGLNPMRWIGYEQIAANSRTIKNMVGNINKPNGSSYNPTSFEDCMQHYGLSEADLKQRMKNSLLIARACLAFSLLMLCYTIYLFIRHMPLSAIICIVLTLLLWAYAFREHFNYFQMKQRRLGCTFKDWFAAIFKGKKQ
jgi:intracellular multiplication protein IcmV